MKDGALVASAAAKSYWNCLSRAKLCLAAILETSNLKLDGVTVNCGLFVID